MATLFKPRLTRYIDAAGKRVVRETTGARKVQSRAKKWYGQFRDADGVLRRRPLCSDKSAAQAMLADLVRKATHERAGLTDPFEDHRKRPIAEHIASFRDHLQAKGRAKDHIAQSVHAVELVVEGCGFRRLTDLSASRVSQWLADLKESGRSARTCNYYLVAIKSFCRWLVLDRRMPDSPLAHLTKLNEAVDARLLRRTLAPPEFSRLVERTAASATGYRGLSGRDRAMLYVVAANSGLRAGELASLTVASLQLGDAVPVIAVAASYSKRRRRDLQPIPEWVAEQLRAWLRSKKDEPATDCSTLLIAAPSQARDEKLWPGSWSSRAAEMIRGDLEAAEIPFADDDGGVFDFHALRHQYITNLAAAGAPPKVAQTLARHSTITLTMDRYTHLAAADVAGAVESLPVLVTNRGSAQATGTDGGARRPFEDDGSQDSAPPSATVVSGANRRSTSPEFGCTNGCATGVDSGHFVSTRGHLDVPTSLPPTTQKTPGNPEVFAAEGKGFEPAAKLTEVLAP